MEENTVFASLAIIIGATVVAALVFHRLRQSMIIAYFVSGVVIGPGCLNFVRDEGVISVMAEVGVIVLMFTLGIEFSMAKLKRLKRAALRGGSFYVFSLMIGALLVMLTIKGAPFDVSLGNGLIIGLVLAMSSTAIAIRMLDEEGQINTAQAQLTIGTSIFQDIIVVPAMIIIPAVISGGGNVTGTLWMALVKAVLFLLVAYVLARYVIPFILEYVADTRSRELFTIMVLGLCLGIAFVGNLLGLSLALGAFVAGLVVSESIYSHKILADILPFKDFFLSIFFVSAGLLLDVGYLMSNVGLIACLAGGGDFGEISRWFYRRAAQRLHPEGQFHRRAGAGDRGGILLCAAPMGQVERIYRGRPFSAPAVGHAGDHGGRAHSVEMGLATGQTGGEIAFD